jgi:hypothetical protein
MSDIGHGFRQTEPLEQGDLVFALKVRAVVLTQEMNEFQKDVLILNHVEATALRDWLNLALEGTPT